MTTQPDLFTDQDFDGETYEPAADKVRLNAQASRVWRVMAAGHWMTLRDVSHITGDPEASVSARIRDFRKPRFGGHSVHRKRVQEYGGTWAYKLIPRAMEMELSL